MIKHLLQRHFSILFSLIFTVLLLTGCSSVSNTPISRTGLYMHTVVTVTIYDASKKSLLEDCMNMVDSYDKLLSPTIEGSDIWKINHSEGTPVTVSDDTLTLLNAAIEYARLSDGIVDPSVGALSTLWNFGTDNQEIIPSEEAISQALSHIDYKMITISDHTVTLTDPEASLNLGFIAKGFIADKLKAYLVENGITSGIIDLGHNILTIGTKPDGSAFQIGIQEPFADTGENAAILSITDQSVVSSGTYEQYFEKNGTLYHHILSTKTGYPMDNELNAVTILSPESMDGDALSTLCFLLGAEKGSALIESIPDTEALFITKDGTQICTSGFPR